MKRTPKYYTYNKTHKLYQVKKRIKGDWHYFGYYHTSEEAEEIVELLKSVNWEKEKLPLEIQDRINSTPNNYTRLKEGKYMVRKTCRNKNYYFGLYGSKKEATEIVELLKKNNWNRNCLDIEIEKGSD